MVVFKYKGFHKWAKQLSISDVSLQKAIHEMERGLFGSLLGKEVYKIRIPRIGQGKRVSYRSLIAFRNHDRAIFMYGFAKNDRQNISKNEKEMIQNIAQYYLKATFEELEKLQAIGELIKVIYEK